jgi:hypothetical protein
MTQFSLFGAAVAEPALDDLGGVLLGGGHWVRSAAGARLSVVVRDRWRADALVATFVALGIDCSDALVEAEGGFAARTAFAAGLVEAAVSWTRGANEAPPPAFVLSAGGLRMWAITAGQPDEVGYLLATAERDDAVHLAGGAQLSRLGLGAVSISSRSRPGWRVTSIKRIRRLVELLGEAPPGAEQGWPRTR